MKSDIITLKNSLSFAALKENIPFEMNKKIAK
jgi:hypothetical protein